MDITFKRPALEDRDTILKHLAERKLHGCERTFANVYLWARFYNEGWAEIEGTAVFRTGQEGAYSYTYPIGAGDRKKVVEMLMEDAKEKGYPFQLHAVSKGEMEELESYFPGKFNVEWPRDREAHQSLRQEIPWQEKPSESVQSRLSGLEIRDNHG